MTAGDASGRTALVTGGTDGIGKEIARGLAARGARVLIVGRDLVKGSRAERELRHSSGNRSVEFLPADLMLMREARRVADEVVGRCSALHYLVHSAGLIRGRHELTDEGIESNFAINYVSRFVVTNQLLCVLQAAGQPGRAARILIIGGAARNGRIRFEGVNLTGKFNSIRAVGQFCQANDVFTVELARRLAAECSQRVTVANLKIGVVRTNIRRRPDFPRIMKVLAPLLDPFLAMGVETAGAAGLRILLEKEYEDVNGALFLMIKKFQRISPSPSTADPQTGRRLWELSQQISGPFEWNTEPVVAAEKLRSGG